MKKILPLLIGISLTSVSLLSHAENLLQVYQQAKETNPDLRKSLADRNAAYAQIGVSRGSLLPQLSAQGSYTATRGYRSSSGTSSNAAQGTLSLQQTIFDMSKWRLFSIDEKKAVIQDMTYKTSQQQLILDTTTAYFNVLKAIDTLSFTEAQKKAIYKQLEQVKQQYQVGLKAITDVQNTKSQYDTVLAQEVSARNDLDNKLEILRKISGIYYPELNTVNMKKFKTNKPDQIDSLLEQADKNNLSLISARLMQDVYREQIKLAQTGHMPTISLNASTELTHNHKREKDYAGNRVSGSSVNGGNNIGVTLSVPLFSGGSTSSGVTKAQYDYLSSTESLDSTTREVINKVRSSHNNVSAAISTITAYRQAVISAQSSLDATQAGYRVGTRTIVDVLNATSTLYDAKKNLSGARYDYLISLFTLKSALGTLNEEDIIRMNSLLGKKISTQATTIAPVR